MQAGEFWWKLALDATPALPQPPIMLSAALGSTTSYALAVANPTPVEATFTTSSSCPDRFWLVPDTFKVGIVLLRWSVLHMQATLSLYLAWWHHGNAVHQQLLFLPLKLQSSTAVVVHLCLCTPCRQARQRVADPCIAT